jgi:signal transduction histidine kinase
MLTFMPEGRLSLSPLALAALALVGEEVDRQSLVQRFGEAGAAVADEAAADLLAQLADLGMIRVARASASEATYVTTSLGSKIAARTQGGRAPAQLHELETLRTDLLSTIAHEMRTPLTAVRTSVGVLRYSSARPTAAQSEALLDVIERNADRMQRLIGDILDLSRFRAGTIRLQSRRFDAREMAHGVVEGIRPLADQRRQTLELRSARGDTTVFGDHRRLEQALLNLVSNAQRFAPDGGHVAVHVRGDGETMRWSVTDDGPGIPAADRRRLFERFFVGRSDRNSPRDGVGLGLPTALAIAQAHGGTIEVRSRPGTGSTFTLAVPVAGPVAGPED